MNELTKAILDRGAEALHEMIADKRDETLFLEFKHFKSIDKEVLSTDARKREVKAVCGLANAEGGTLVIGIQTKKVDEIDRADSPVLLKDATAFANRLTSALAENLDPQHPGIGVHPILDAGGPAGFVVVDVPASDRRPHMSVAKDEGRYFRRGLIGTHAMTNGEVRDLMFAPRRAALEIDLLPSLTPPYSYEFNSIKLTLRIRNVGSAAAVAPFAVFEQGEPETNHIVATNFTSHQDAENGIRFYSGRDFIIHQGEIISPFILTTGVAFLFGQYIEGEDLAEKALASSHPNVFAITPVRPSDRYFAEDALPVLRGYVAAENADRVVFDFQWERKELLTILKSVIPPVRFR